MEYTLRVLTTTKHVCKKNNNFNFHIYDCIEFLKWAFFFLNWAIFFHFVTHLQQFCAKIPTKCLAFLQIYWTSNSFKIPQPKIYCFYVDHTKLCKHWTLTPWISFPKANSEIIYALRLICHYINFHKILIFSLNIVQNLLLRKHA